MRPRAREKKVSTVLAKIGAHVDALVTLSDIARLLIERNEKGEYVVTDGKASSR
jgi:hypothetical protein